MDEKIQENNKENTDKSEETNCIQSNEINPNQIDEISTVNHESEFDKLQEIVDLFYQPLSLRYIHF